MQIYCLAADPHKSGQVYAGTRDHGIQVSEDSGKNWRGLGLEGIPIKSLAVSPHQPGVIYAGSKPVSLFVSRDFGANWDELPSLRAAKKWWWFSPADPPDWRPYVQALTISPSDPDVILAGIELGAVLRSEDGGKSWSRHLRGALRDCHSLKFHLTDGNWAYEAGGTGGGAAFSRDGGRTWRKAKKGLAKSYGMVCAADPEKPEVWYVCTAPSPYNAYGQDPKIYLYRSIGGAGWQPIGWEPHPISSPPSALISLPGAPGHLFAGLRNGQIWHTADYGDSWAPMPFKTMGIYSLAVL
jgi:hypothetical protein